MGKPEIKAVHFDEIKKKARIYTKKLEKEDEQNWLVLLPFDYYGEEAFLYKKEQVGYAVTGRTYIVNKKESEQMKEMVRRSLRFAHVKGIYI